MRRSLEKINRLGVLTREIRRDYGALQQLVERTRRNCNEVVAETILLGNKLIEAKRLVEHGSWCEWLAKHCPDIHGNTARNYMRLANSQHVGNLKTQKSLRQAYLAVGIIQTDETINPMPAVAVGPAIKKIGPPRHDANGNAVTSVLEATVVEQPMVLNEPSTVPVVGTPAETPVTRVKGKVGDLMQCLKPLDTRCRKKVAVHLKPLVIFYHRFGKS
ncbi:MAG TPA: DUF3102 domain-containing protein [Verrucomicrobiae bacterium]|nr:DUF3102 domain-containing protein [Verrucomicrobiae bacterium]